MIDYGTLATIAVVILGFIAQAGYLKGSFTAKIENHEKEIDELKDKVRYKDTCKSMFEGICGRVTRLEGLANGKRRA